MSATKQAQESVAPRRESKHVEFKDSFDPAQLGEWCELIKDIVAIANSGGGRIFVGLRNDGQPSNSDISGLLQTDPAQFVDKLDKYTGEQFSEIEVSTETRDGAQVAVIRVGPTPIPLVFLRPGTYETEPSKQKTAFSRGTVYFRHGAKSEPGTTKDLRQTVERELNRVRKQWLGGIRKITTAPTGHRIAVLPPEIKESSSPIATPIRIVEDPSAPTYRRLNPDETHPYRQKDVARRFNEISDGGKTIIPYAVQCIRKVYNIDQKEKFFYRSKFSSLQYSDEFVVWLIEQSKKNPKFFEDARALCLSRSQPNEQARGIRG
ncbi:MAG TPA: RNA-binding domain-containing protein [Candidatus Binataceae bacterium]|nr:RNA-binding domain-containing protein [Candidatus Binataceae bacterium]